MKTTTRLFAAALSLAALTPAFGQPLTAPVIIQQPLSQSVCAGGSVTLSVTVSNTATLPIGYRWRRNGTNVSFQSLNQYTSFFTITNAPAGPTNYTVVVTNAANPAGVLSASALLTVIPGPVTFAVAGSALAENAGAVMLLIQRGCDTNPLVSVDYATRDNSAVAGLDYVARTGTLTFAPGQTTQTLSIPILNDGQPEGVETFSVELFNLSPPLVPNFARTTTVTILDNDAGLAFTAAGVSVNEDAELATFTVRRADDGPNTVTVDYATSDLTATAGLDYLARSGTLTFLSGESNQSFTVPILNDGLAEGDETVHLTLRNPTGGAVLGGGGVAELTADLTLRDNDTGIQFSAPQYSVWETGGVATITVLRGDDLNDWFTVDYATGGGTATPGADYSARSGTLHFAADETIQTILIPIRDDGLDEGPETLNLSLTNPSAEVSLGANSNAVLTIVDDERPLPIAPGQVKSIAAGGFHTLALKADGSLWAWGDNHGGPLGDGSIETNRTAPVRVGTDNDWTAVAASGVYSVALKADGSLWAWGSGWSQTGPGRIGAENDWSVVAAGQGRAWYTLALKTDGSLWLLIPPGPPVRIGADNDWTAVAPAFCGLALKTDGSLWQVSGMSQRVGTDNDWFTVTGGGDDCWHTGHVLALKVDGSLFAWGQNGSGQLGDGTTEYRPAPVPISTDNDWAAITAGSAHSAALKQDGSLWAWGGNWSGQLGNGTLYSTNRPVRIGSDNEWVLIAAGGAHTVALKTDGSLWAWGYNFYGQLGNGTTMDINIPVRVGTDNDWAVPLRASEFRITSQAVGGDGRFRLAFTTTNYFSYFILYRGTEVTNIHQPVDATLGPFVFQLSDSTPVSSHATAFYGVRAVPFAQPLDLDADGIDDVYELRHRAFLNPLNPADAALDFDGDGKSNLQEYRSGTDPARAQVLHVVASGLGHTVVLKTDGSLWAWGDNSYGQLGDGTTDSRNAPVRIGADTHWISVTAGRDYANGDHTVALKRDGSLWAWGANYWGQLGDGTTDYRSAPERIGSGNDWSEVAAGGGYTMALKRDGSLWAWGNNLSGGSQLLPVRVGTTTDWLTIAAGGPHALALKTDRSLWAWGDNFVGQCGFDPNVVFFVSEPTRVGTNTDWKVIAASGELDTFYAHSSALSMDGSLWSWGYNEWGQLGLGSLDATNTPTRVGTDTDWAAMAVSPAHSVALKRDGSLWAWGQGIGNQPARVGTSNDWRAFAVGGLPHDFGLPGFSVGLKTDGSLWFWPLDSAGSVPLRVGTDNDWGSPP